MNDEIHRFDVRYAQEIDQKVNEQQDIMSKTGLRAFVKSQLPSEIKFQMYLLDLIERLSRTEIPL
jgi:hypothetical protein